MIKIEYDFDYSIFSEIMGLFTSKDGTVFIKEVEWFLSYRSVH